MKIKIHQDVVVIINNCSECYREGETPDIPEPEALKLIKAKIASIVKTLRNNKKNAES